MPPKVDLVAGLVPGLGAEASDKELCTEPDEGIVGCVPSPVAVAIRSRAETVKKPGAWLGIFEWLVWGASQKVHVHMLFGSYPVDIREVFAPYLIAVPSHRPVHRVAAVHLKNGKWYSAAAGEHASHPQMNHYVAAIAADSTAGAGSGPGGISGTCGGEGSGPGGSSSTCGKGFGPSDSSAACKGSAEASAKQGGCSHMAVRAALSVGWRLQATDATGDCGPDSMAAAAKRVRIPDTWAAIRTDIANFMMSVADDPRWQEAFKAAQELTPPPQPQLAQTGSQKPVIQATGSEAVGGMGPPMKGGADSCKTAYGSAWPPASGQASAVSGGTESDLSKTPLPSHGPDTSAIVSGEASCQASGQSATASSQEDWTSVGTFNDWLMALAPEKLAEITMSYAAFSRAEDVWLEKVREMRRKLKATIPTKLKRTRSATNLKFKVATGMAYRAWRAGAGRDCKAPLRDRVHRNNATYVCVCSAHVSVYTTRYNRRAHVIFACLYEMRGF